MAVPLHQEQRTGILADQKHTWPGGHYVSSGLAASLWKSCFLGPGVQAHGYTVMQSKRDGQQP